jgi:hypothetical protein
MDLTKQLEHLLNANSEENKSNTPDFILASYLRACLTAYNQATNRREKWYGRTPPVNHKPRRRNTKRPAGGE